MHLKRLFDGDNFISLYQVVDLPYLQTGISGVFFGF